MDKPPQQRQPMPGETATAPPGYPGPADRSVHRGRRLRLFLVVSAGMAALLCLGGVGVAVLLYDDATKIDRSAPDVVVDNYLRAFLVKRDDAQAALFRCKGPAGMTELERFRSDLVEREGRYSMSIVVSWSSLSIESAGQQATVSTDLRRSVADGSELLFDRWQFRLVDEDGWRVCSATKVG